MIRDFSREELEPVTTGHDTEFTLGGGSLFVLGFGLLLLCAICFGAGYLVGHRNLQAQAAPAAVPDPNAQISPNLRASGLKPGAGGEPALQPQADQSATAPAGVAGGATSGTDAATASLTGNPLAGQAQVKPALDTELRPVMGTQANAGQPAPALPTQSAATPMQGWMVQIAAVAHPDDAEVLVNALRRRGYAVTARRDASDNLIHVQTGPYMSRNDANVVRQKLLNDGYNAIVQ